MNNLFFYVMTAMVTAPIAEEFLFRFGLQQTLKKAWGELVAIIITASLFAAVHMVVFPTSWVYILPGALVLGFVFNWSKDPMTGIRNSILTHMLLNSITILPLIWNSLA